MSFYNRKVVIVTGASNGIGSEIARQFGSEGATVIIADIDTGNGKAVADKINKSSGRGHYFRTDVSDPDSIKNMIKQTVNLCDRIDVLVNNAGISEFQSPFEITVEQWDKVLNTNLRSCFLCTREAAKTMGVHKSGSVINIASTRACMSEKNSEAYAASKGGIISLTHAFALSLSELNIRVNCISPGWIHTGERNELYEKDHLQHPARRVGKPADIARACLFLAHSNNDFITGQNLIIDGGMTRKMIYEE